MHFAKFRLYHCPATRSVRVKWLLCELLGDQFELELVSLYDNEHMQSGYLRKNPNHNVPTLQITMRPDETMYMVESGAMLSLLADAFPEKGLAPPPGDLSFRRADYLQMLHFAASSMDMMLWQIRAHEHLLPERERDVRTSKRYRRKFVTEVEPLERGALHLWRRLQRGRLHHGTQRDLGTCLRHEHRRRLPQIPRTNLQPARIQARVRRRCRIYRRNPA
jgi:glutathione S-transferase